MGLLARAIEVERALFLESNAIDGRLNTDIDRLYYLVRSDGKITIKKAANQLSLDMAQCSEFARILTNQNLIATKRPLIGDTLLVCHEKDHFVARSQVPQSEE